MITADFIECSLHDIPVGYKAANRHQTACPLCVAEEKLASQKHEYEGEIRDLEDELAEVRGTLLALQRRGH